VDISLIDDWGMKGYYEIENKLNDEIHSMVEDYAMEYISSNKKDRLTYDGFLSNKMLIIQAIKSGIPYSLFDLIQAYTPFNENDWASFLDVSTKSLQRYKTASNFYFKPIHSEKIIEMAEVTKTGLEVFGSTEKLKLWLNTPNYSFNNLKPIDLLSNSYGKDMVLGELVRIEHGIFV
jgi:putative toxin-antitoxin system antitoxin component (TIGR02293 family)